MLPPLRLAPPIAAALLATALAHNCIETPRRTGARLDRGSWDWPDNRLKGEVRRPSEPGSTPRRLSMSDVTKGGPRLRPLPRCALAAKFLAFQAINGLVMIWMMYVTDGRWPTTIHTTVYAPLREIIVLIVVPSF